MNVCVILSVFCLHTLYALYVCLVCERGRKSPSGPLELALAMVVSLHVDDGNPALAQVLLTTKPALQHSCFLKAFPRGVERRGRKGSGRRERLRREKGESELQG